MKFKFSRKEIAKMLKEKLGEKASYFMRERLMAKKEEIRECKHDFTKTYYSDVHICSKCYEVRPMDKVQSEPIKEDVWERKCTGCGGKVGWVHSDFCKVKGLSVCVLLEQTYPEPINQSLKEVSNEHIQPLNLSHTTTSRPELRQTEKEIMLENKINELIEYLNR